MSFTPQPIRGMSIDKNNPIARGLVGYWPMLEGTGSKLDDYSGNGNRGTLSATMGPGDWHPGSTGFALDLQDEVDYVVCGSAGSNLAPTQGLTVSAWYQLLKENQTHSLGGLVWGPNNTSGSSYILTARNDGYVHFFIRDGGSWRSIICDSAFARYEWHYYVGTWDGSTMRIYMDGLLQSDTASASSINYNTPTDPLKIGLYGFDNSPDGLVTGVSVHDRALSQSEIATLYADPWALFRRRLVIPTEAPPAYDIQGSNAYGSDQISFNWTVNPA